jgi:hypothetical protein
MTPISHTARPRSAQAKGRFVLVGLVLVAWLVVIVVAGRAGMFDAGPGRPPLPILVAVVLPPAVFALLYRLTDRVRDFALSIDLRLLTAMQAWRVGGVMFMVLYAFGLLPGLFAWPAGLGDFAVGLAAPFVLQALVARGAGWQFSVFWLNVAGLVDFAVAIGTGVLSSNSSLGIFAGDVPSASMGALPLSIVPTFAVPLWTIFHMISLIQLRRMAAGYGGRAACGPSVSRDPA